MSDSTLCDSFAEDWSAYQDGELVSDRESAMAAHLPGCPVCCRRVAALQAADAALLADLPLVEVPYDLRTRLQQRIDGAIVAPIDPSGERHRSRPVRRVAGALLAVAAALVLYLAVRGGAPAEFLDDASDEELAAALELETIEDFDVIENLDLLEALSLLGEETG